MSARDAVAKAEAALAEAKQKLDEERARRQIKCKSCGKYHAIRSLHLVVPHWYVEPHGCTGGDYWNEGEWVFLCPADGARNRIMFNEWDLDWRERGSVYSAFKRAHPPRLWRSSTQEHERCTPVSLINYYIDEHRARFELPEKKKK